MSRLTEQHTEQLVIYRGWMLRPQGYRALYDALLTRGARLINSPSEYLHVHYLPESYTVIEHHTPDTVWQPLAPGQVPDFDSLMSLLDKFGDSPVVVKDYMKSEKHYWNEACFIPDPRNRKSVERIVSRFLELRSEDLSGGLVFRRFAPLAGLGYHPESGMPLSEEYRIFFLYGSPLYSTEYWEYGEYPQQVPVISRFFEVAAQVQSQFFTMDVARGQDGTWIIVELGDAQVAGLPERANPVDFYNALASHLIV